MELALQASGISIEQGKRKTTTGKKHIVRIERTATRQRNLTADDLKVSHAKAGDAISLLRARSGSIDAILIDATDLPENMDRIKNEAKVRAVPLIVYSSVFEKEVKSTAVRIGADDYHFGPLDRSFLKRLDFIRKVKSYRKQRGDQLYATRKFEPTPEIKLWSLKRAFDIVVSFTALLLLSPICLLIGAVIMLESRGPVFYISKRAGSGYKIFDFYKFRSMRCGADAELNSLVHLNQYAPNAPQAVFFKLKDDPRITRFGEFLRKTSLDEIPQLFNVLIGDMSLVGNRPLPLYEAEKLTRDQIAWRFLAPAGITGLWQITKRGKDNMSEDERIALDMEYAMKNSFWLDLRILFATIPALLQKEKV